MRATAAALPQGPSLRSGLCCPGPSTLIRPHPPHSPAHRSFAARRLICDAFAVRERLGNPRVVPSFHCHSFPACRPQCPRGGYRCIYPVPSRLALTFAERSLRLGPSRCQPFRGIPVRFRYNLLSCSPPFRKLLLPGFRRFGRPLRRRILLRCQLGNLHRRDSHPLEWQLSVAARPPRFLEDPTVNVPCSSTPVGPWRSATAALWCCLPRFGTTSTPTIPKISRLNHTARPLAVYASQGGLPHHHARLASGWLASLVRAGVATRWVPTKSFRLFSFSFPRLPLAHPEISAR
jgi:hypothetical protein